MTYQLPEPALRALVLQCLDYNKDTGVFTWKMQRGTIRIGSIAGSKLGDYWSIRLSNKTHLAHRIAILYVDGAFPAIGTEIDHINGDSLDNSYSNLRVVSKTINNQNRRRAYKTNKSGYLGVHKEPLYTNNPWKATIKVSGKSLSIGHFPTPELAHAAYIDAKRKYHEGNML